MTGNTQEACKTAVVLASASPRRRELLEGADVEFACLVTDVDESADESLAPEEQAVEIASRKARAALDALGGEAVRPIVACDTTVVAPDGRIFGKMGHAERVGACLYKNVPGDYDMQMFASAVEYFK